MNELWGLFKAMFYRVYHVMSCHIFIRILDSFKYRLGLIIGIWFDMVLNVKKYNINYIYICIGLKLVEYVYMVLRAYGKS